MGLANAKCLSLDFTMSPKPMNRVVQAARQKDLQVVTVLKMVDELCLHGLKHLEICFKRCSCDSTDLYWEPSMMSLSLPERACTLQRTLPT